MRIAIIAPGSRGDVQPNIALGKGLDQTGHAIRLMTHSNFETLVRSHGLEFWPIEVDVQVVDSRDDMRDRAAELGRKIQAEAGVSRG